MPMPLLPKLGTSTAHNSFPNSTHIWPRLASVATYFACSCTSAGDKPSTSKRPSKKTVVLAESELKLNSRPPFYFFSNQVFSHFTPAPLCCHHYLVLSEPWSDFAPRGRIRPIGGGLIRRPY